MAWIEFHQTLIGHPKTRKLARLLRVHRAQAIGHLAAFWCWCLDYAPDGDLSKLDACDLAEASAWDGNAEEFIAAMVGAGFLDACEDDELHVHDWHDYAGRLVEMREATRHANAERQKRKRDRDRHVLVTRDVTDPSRAVTGLTVPNPTQPNHVPPYPPPGGGEEVPFTEPLLPEPRPDDQPEVRTVLEEQASMAPITQRAAGPDLSRPATAFPKPSRADESARLKASIVADTRLAEFRAAWPKRKGGRHSDRIPDLVRFWEGFKVGESPRFEHTMAALEAKKACPDWTRTDKDCIPAPAAWINSQPWLAYELPDAQPAAPPNPYQHKPWGPIFAQAGMPMTSEGWMNLAYEAAPDRRIDPYEVGRIFAREGPEAAGDWFWKQLSTG